MSEQVVKRYDISGFGGGMVERADGAWCHMDDYDALHAEAEALRAENGRLSQQLAQSDSALRESRANDMASMRTIGDMRERHDALHAELEAARGLLSDARELISHGDFDTGVCCCGSSVANHGLGDGHSPVDEGGYYAGGVSERIDAFLATATPAPEVRCNACDGTGDVHRPDGEWLGSCHCANGEQAK